MVHFSAIKINQLNFKTDITCHKINFHILCIYHEDSLAFAILLPGHQ